MGLSRIFLGTRQPALWAAVDFLLKTYARGTRWAMNDVVVVAPGGRAGRRLLEILVATSQARGLALFAPSIVTVGRLPELLYVPGRPFANDLTQRLAWAHVVRTFDRQKAAHVIPGLPGLEETEQWPNSRWLELGDMLAKQHRTLAGDGLNFRSVAEKGRSLEGFKEFDRWNVLAEMQDRYLRTLDELGLWDLQTARLVAVEKKECVATRDLVLLGAVDMDRTMRNMLDQVERRVTSLVFAPEEWANRFDAYGCLVPTAWKDAAATVPLEKIRIVDSPSDQAAAVVEVLTSYRGEYRADEITIGVPDSTMVPTMKRFCRAQGIPVRYGPGVAAAESAPARLLAAVGDYLEHPGFREFAALVRHPDVAKWLGCQNIPPTWIVQLDEYFSSHLSSRLDSAWLGKESDYHHVAQVHRHVTRILARLMTDERKSLAAWGELLERLLLEFYGDKSLAFDQPGDRAILAACEAIGEAVEEHEAAPSLLAPLVTSSEAIDHVFETLRAKLLPEAANPQAVELLGWLELPLDDSPALIITSMNEGTVPEYVNSDLFLPNALRESIGVVDNARRYARDAYALGVMLASRENLTLIAGRRTNDGTPLLPSRLLLQCDPSELPQRVRSLLGADRSESQTSIPTSNSDAIRSGGALSLRDSKFKVPYPSLAGRKIDALSVTDFRAYLECPYRFFLSRVLRLKSLTDKGTELDGMAFGDTAHEVLKRFAETACRDATDADEIFTTLNELLDAYAAETFGKHAMPAVQVQLEQLRLRLGSFAKHQALWRSEGWKIIHRELTIPKADAKIMVDGEPMPLKGRIDRIDENEKTGAWAILDYKTSESVKTPEKSHRTNDGTWIDLQLPLYRHLVASLRPPAELKVGYVILPKSVDEKHFTPASWTERDFDSADLAAAEVVRGIRKNIFWPPVSKTPFDYDDFADICQTGIFERALAEPPGGAT